MKYLFFLIIFLIPIGFAEGALIFSSDNPSVDGDIRDSDNDDNCEAVPAAFLKDTAGTRFTVGRAFTGEATDCSASFVQWDTTTIPDTATILDVDFLYEIDTIEGGVIANCDYVKLNQDATTATDSQIWTGIQSSATPYILSNVVCKTIATNSGLDLGATADSDLQSLLSSNRFVVGIRGTGDIGQAGDATNHRTYFASEENATPVPKPTLRVAYATASPVTTLTATDIRPNGVDLSWTQPNLNGGTLQGYQINFTTPWSSNVASVRINSTNSSTTTYSVTGLTGSTQYSFRIGIWTTTAGDLNPAGNVLNITTDFDPTGSFTPGTFSTNFTGTDVRTIKYEQTNINSTYTRLNVTAPTTIELNCNFHYKFAATNRTYTNIANVSISPTEDEATFRFFNVDREIIDVLCWNQYDNETNARYLISQTAFPFLEQIEDFRNGTFGTAGMFGALDFISMIAVICSMIGFNRVNETVGVIFGLFMLGGLAVLSNGEIISWASTFTVGFAVLIMWAIGTTRKD